MIYQSTPDYYRDYIEHGWFKDQTKKAHKYIERWKGKNGKWYYKYKSKFEELSAKRRRKKAGIINPAEISRTADYGTKHARVMRVGPNEIDNGRGFKRSPGLRNTYDRNWTWTFNKQGTTKVKLKKNKNLKDRGYSRAEGNVRMRVSNLYNNSTRRPPSYLEVKKYLKNDGKNSPSIVFKETKSIYDNYGSGTNNYLRKKRR